MMDALDGYNEIVCKMAIISSSFKRKKTFYTFSALHHPSAVLLRIDLCDQVSCFDSVYTAKCTWPRERC